MGRDPTYNAKLDELAAKADALGLEGVFAPPGEGLPPEAMAVKLWELGYRKLPTVAELLSELERKMESIQKEHNPTTDDKKRE